MASGYGRGGRGAALLQALNQPVRKPGEAPSGGATQDVKNESAAAAAPAAPAAGKPAPSLGRGAFLQQMLAGQAAKPAAPAPSMAPPAAQPPATQQPSGRGGFLPATTAPHQAITRPLGRAAYLHDLQQATTPGASPASSAPATAPGPCRPVGRGLANMQALSTPSAPSSAPPPAVKPDAVTPEAATPAARAQPAAHTARQVAPASAAASQDAPSDDRPSRLEHMLSTMNLDKPAVTCKGSVGESLPICVNYIPLRSKNEGVFQYAVSFSPPIDSRALAFKLLYEHLNVIGTTKAFDGAILFLPIKLQKETRLTSNRPTDGQEITISVKLVKVLPHAACPQLYNVILRKIMSILKMCQVGRHYYDPHRPQSVPQHRLEVWPGYVTAIQEYEGGLMLNTDVSHRVLRTETVLDVMQDLLQKNRSTFETEITRRLIGCTVLTRYNNKTYRVDDIAWSQNPTSTFTNSSGESISFVDYYKNAYNKEIRDLQQPLLLHRPKKKDRIPGKKALDVICLIPELSYMTGLTDEMRSDFKVMKDLATHTRITPMQRHVALRKFCENVSSHPEANAELEKWGLQLDHDVLKLEGRRLPKESVIFKNRRFKLEDDADWGRYLSKDQVISAVDLVNWLVLVTRRDSSKANDFIQNMVSCGQQIGMRVAMPRLIELDNDRTETYVRATRDSINPQVQMVVVIFPTSRDDRYNAFKKLTCVEMPVPSQVINARTISQKQKLRSVVQKVALQINCKLGGELWGVEIPLKSLMVCGIDVYHEVSRERLSIGGFVASLNNACTRWFSRVCHQSSGQELIDGLKLCFTASLRKYHEVNHCLPERIVLYRDGVGDGQLDQVAGYEVAQLEQCFKFFGDGYQPRLAVIVVQKRINTRILAMQGRQLENPPPGSVVDHTVTRKDRADFFLVSQHVRQGTVSPTHYVIVHGESDWKVDHMQRLTYKMTHLYYNWPGTVRVPAPCQYAHKLAYLVGQNIRKDPSPELSDRLFFL